jgi:endonuclease/exonuclease/phosphatase (EEP) superfamily protein YafD
MYDSFSAMLKRIWNVVQVGIFGYGLAVCGYLLARWLVGESWNWVAFINNFVPWLALVALIVSILSLFTRWRWLLIPLQLPILILFIVFYGEMFWPRAQAADHPAGIEITAANFNIHSDKSDPEAIVAAIDALDADIIGLEEVGPPHSDLIESELGDEYPYRLIYASSTMHGVAFLSRYPILSEEVFNPFVKYVRHVRIVIDVNGTPVVVYLTHPHSPNEMFTRYDDRWRTHQLGHLREWLVRDSDPVLILCDCNMTDQSDDYRALDNLVTDSFREAGWGMGFTFPNGKVYPRMVRIDYVWHSNQFVAYDAYVADDNGTSDHSPMVARLVLREDAER